MMSHPSPPRVLLDLSVAAVLGADRAQGDIATPHRLLGRAAVAGMRTRAGRRSRLQGEEIRQCPKDVCAIATPVQAATLDRLLAGADEGLIEEWCALANDRGRRVPPLLVPKVLQWWSGRTRRDPAVFEATGACGAWLASLNSAWGALSAGVAVPENLDEVWQNGSAPERTAALRAVRLREPSRALDMVRATWATDGAEERRRFVEILRTNVTLADEEFLEAALDDRSKGVREEAARALASLSGSAFRDRMRKRAAALVLIERPKSGLLRRAKLVIRLQPPKEFDRAWDRDGLDEQAVTGKGQRAFWMEQILGLTDLCLWTDLSGVAPREVLEALSGDEFFEDAYRAMIMSVKCCPRQPDVDSWCDAFVTTYAEHEVIRSGPWSLCDMIPVERSEKLRLQLSANPKARRKQEVWQILASDARAWSPEFSLQAIALIRASMSKKVEAVQVWGCLQSVTRLLHPDAEKAFEEFVADLNSDELGNSVQKSIDRVRLRAQMRKEFQS